MTDLDAYAAERGIDVFYDAIPETVAMAVPGALCLDWSLLASDAARAVCLAHELGHVETGAFYSRGAPELDRRRAELRARRWAIRRLLPREDLLSALRAGVTSPWDLADRFSLPEPLIREALSLYLVCR